MKAENFILHPFFQMNWYHLNNSGPESKAERSEALNQAKFRFASLWTPIVSPTF